MSKEIEESCPFSEKNISAPINLEDVVYFSTPKEAEEFSKALQGAIELFKTCEIVGVTYPDKTEKSNLKEP